METSTILNPGEIITPAQLAERLKVPISWVYEKTDSRGQSCHNPLPCLRAGRYLRFYWPDIAEWLRSGQDKSKNAHLLN